MGRPPSSNPKVPLNTRVRRDALARLDQVAAAAGLTRSQAVVTALVEWVQRQERQHR